MKNTPIGYSKSSLGKTVSIVIIIFSVILILPMIQNDASFVNLEYFVIFDAVIAILFFMSDVITNRKNAKKIEHMVF